MIRANFPLFKKEYLFICCLPLLLLLAGCGKVELYSMQTERDANEMIGILLREGISSDKAAGADNTFIVNVEKTRFADAVSILNQYGYPRAHFVGIGQVFQKSGLVTSPREENIRFMYALSQELEETLTEIEGVVTARVHIVLPDNDPLSDNNYPSSAAIFLNYRPSSDVPNFLPKIKNLVMNSIEGLIYDKISIALFPVSESKTNIPQSSETLMSILSIQVASTSALRFWIIITTLLIISIGSLCGLIYMIVQKKKVALQLPSVTESNPPDNEKKSNNEKKAE